MGFSRCAWLVVTVSCVAMATLLAACSPSTDEGDESATGSTEVANGAAPDDSASDRVDDVTALNLEGKVDRIVTMLPPEAATRPPAGALPDATLLAARQVLRAPSPRGFVELWILRVRSQEMGPGIMECRVTESEGSSSAGCSSVAAQAHEPPLVGGASGDGSSIVVELNGPSDMTHFVVTTPTGTIGVVPIEAQALLYLDEACPRDTTVAVWRGEELVREAPAVFC